jgi:proteasome lid subunit RPN8/RPN11
MLQIPRRFLEDIVAHALEEDPNECCGLLAGSGDAASRLFRITNSEKSPIRYLMDPKEQFAAFKAIRNEGLSLLAIYHSHTHTPAYPSPTDIRLAFYPEARYLIVSLEKKSVPVIRTYRIVDGKISEENWMESKEAPIP